MKRVPVPNGTTVWVSPNVNQGNLQVPPVNDPSWVEVQRVTALSHAGGDEKLSTHTPLGAYEDVRRPAGRNPMDIQLAYQDAPDSAWHAAVLAARDAQAALAWRFTLPAGATHIVFTAFASGPLLPVMDRNQVMVISLQLAVNGTPQRIMN
ncbi:phage tail tube protein [Pseudomonas sp. DTU_2021_1001937_2_SI_NGA_ILE_001]|uniref:phage tail tube protein n=1 Tax=Pseudomonas sp. DTU_2021_1001937_2_SI_NGA_ILE_001 TaxID=3077589 RepID=UPI0028FC0A54|nr:phage tail tube protein [Pseudomonas sp. DTU_2021_1001937_2_SI_NGA_ILE_001]WNW10128.1 phage tail tube protein [Pseudomonas sp. DTU_2021_1001937_2_SI_NGA_ILE_001]